LGPDHLDTLQVVQNLGVFYYECGRLDEAEKMLMQALAGYEKALGSYHPDISQVLFNLGEHYET
jgi:tetratricopeptide (TPR) repeat protein